MEFCIDFKALSSILEKFGRSKGRLCKTLSSLSRSLSSFGVTLFGFSITLSALSA